MNDRRSDATRRRLLGSIGAIGAIAAIGSLIDASETPPATSSPTPPVESARTGPSTTSSVEMAAAVVESPPPVRSAALVPVTVDLVCRDAWGARPARTGMEAHAPVRLTLHHTEVIQASASEGPARARQHQRHHQSLGWPDLAYHFIVDRAGLAYEGRDVEMRGDTGTTYDPTGHLLVCLEGDFDFQDPTPEQVSATIRLLAWASRQYDLDPGSLAGHSDFADTTCPGLEIAQLIPSMIESVKRVGPVSIDRHCGEAGAELVASVETGAYRSGSGD